MPVTIDGTNGITNGGGYTGDGVSFADATPANTLVTTTTGRVGIGTSSPAGPLSVVSTANGEVIRAQKAGGTNLTLLRVNMDDTANTGTIEVTGAAGNPALCLATAGVERVRINDAGNVGIGTTSPGAKLDVYGTSTTDIFHVRNGTTYFTAGVTDGTQVELNSYQSGVGAKLLALQSAGGITTFGGNVGIGSANAADKLYVVAGANQAGIRVDTPGTWDTIYVAANTGGTAANAVYVLPIRTAGGLRGGIQWNGTNLLYNNSSDARLKENIDDADDAASVVDAIQVRKFDWKETGFHQRYGFIAQELQGVFPEAVSGDPESEEATMAVDYSKLVPMLVKEIQSLRARLAAVEGAIA